MGSEAGPERGKGRQGKGGREEGLVKEGREPREGKEGSSGGGKDIRLPRGRGDIVPKEEKKRLQSTS